MAFFTAAETLQTDANRKVWRRIRWASIVVGFVSMAIVGWLLLSGNGINENGPEAWALFISCGLGLAVFVWSWLSHATNLESQDRLERSWPGRQIQFKEISEHVREFVKEFEVDRLADVSRVDLFLSTLMYGIEDKDSPVIAINNLIGILEKWRNEVHAKGSSEDDYVLHLGLWRCEEHRKIWSVKNGRSKWHTRGDQKETVEVLKAMKRFCALFRNLGSPNGRSINLNVRATARSDLRMFSIKRRTGPSFAMMINFTPFFDEEAKEDAYVHTGFATPSTYGCDRIRMMGEKFEVSEINNPINDNSFIKNPEAYFERFFDLPPNWHKNLQQTARQIRPG